MSVLGSLLGDVVGGAIGKYGIPAASSLLGWPSADGILSTAYRDMGYAANRTGILASPPPEVTLRLYWAGRFGDPDSPDARNTLWTLLGEYGIHKETATPADYRAYGWARHVELSRPLVDWNTLLGAYRAGWPNIDEAMLRLRLKRDGIYGSFDQDILIGLGRQLGLSEAIQLYLRQEITLAELTARYKAAGVVDPVIQQRISTLALHVPDTLELTRMGTRGAFNGLLEGYGYFDNPDPGILALLATKGMSWGKNVPPARGGTQGTGRDWSELVFGSHRPVPDPHFAREIYHRLNAGGINRYAPVIPNLQPFTIDDWSNLLRMGGWPEKMIPWIQVGSFQRPRLFTVVQAVTQGIKPAAWAENTLLTYGYLPEDAKLIADIAQSRVDQVAARPVKLFKGQVRSRAIKCMTDAYDAGILSGQEAVANLIGMGIEAADANAWIQTADLCAKANLAKQAIQATKSAFLRGEISREQAIARLETMGITPQKQEQYLEHWDVLFTPKRRQLGTADVLYLVANGLMDEVSAISRLSNLGWVQPDAILMLSKAELQLTRRQAAASMAAQRQAQTQARQLEAAREKALRQAAELQKAAWALEPLASLKKWLKLGLITVADFTAKLEARGYPAATIKLYIEEVENGPTKPGGSKPPGSNGSTGAGK